MPAERAELPIHQRDWRCKIGLHRWIWREYRGLGPWTGSRRCKKCGYEEPTP